MGVWIEILYLIRKRNFGAFTPVWGCGLKFVILLNFGVKLLFTPVWGCGLKWASGMLIGVCVGFTPVWGCGLKSTIIDALVRAIPVHPRVGVWIEIV